MPRYIDAEQLIRDLIDNKEFYPALVKRAIENAPIADVVPRSEVEELKQKLDFLHKENCKLTQSNFEHLVKLVEEAEQEVARVILGDLENRITETNGLFSFPVITHEFIAELEKKYIGE